MINGNNIFIALNSTAAPFAATRSNEISTDCGEIEVSSPNAGDWKQFLAGRKEWSFTVSWLVGNANAIKNNLLKTGSTLTIHIFSRTNSSSTEILTGSAICTKCKITATRGNIANGSFAFRGTGALAEPQPFQPLPQ